MATFQLTDNNLEKLKECDKSKKLFYRVHRIFPDNTYSKWQKGVLAKSSINGNCWEPYLTPF